ncbi:hypothetical protein BJX64DRAFT_289685 [Aspergillus heterothallicus]
MPMVWNDQADAKLLVAIISTSNAKLNHAAIAEFMGSVNDSIANALLHQIDCTASSVQHRIQRLREKVKTIDGSADGTTPGNGTTEGNTTPRKRGRPKKSVAAVDKNEKAVGEDDNSAKKPKTAQKGKRQTKVVKEEDVVMADGAEEPSEAGTD